MYRVSGNKLDVDRLKTVLEAGLLGSQEMLGAHYPDKHVVAGAVKKVSRHEKVRGCLAGFPSSPLSFGRCCKSTSRS